MGKTYTAIDTNARRFIDRQHMFFVATAPLDAAGHVNLSPKGLDSFRVVDDGTVAYLDYVGSGAETIAHLRENGRITIMFCAFDGAPSILRIWGRGEVIAPTHTDYSQLRALFAPGIGDRAVIRVRVERVGDTCGFGVPRYAYEGQRTQLVDWAARKGEAGLEKYQRDHNTTSIDGLPAVVWLNA